MFFYNHTKMERNLKEASMKFTNKTILSYTALIKMVLFTGLFTEISPTFTLLLFVVVLFVCEFHRNSFNTLCWLQIAGVQTSNELLISHLWGSRNEMQLLLYSLVLQASDWKTLEYLPLISHYISVHVQHALLGEDVLWWIISEFNHTIAQWCYDLF